MITKLQQNQMKLNNPLKGLFSRPFDRFCFLYNGILLLKLNLVVECFVSVQGVLLSIRFLLFH
jgi:hypothetical protein